MVGLKNKKTIIVALVAVAVIALIGGTLAYFASTATVENTYSSSSYETVVERNLGGLSGIQPGDVITLDNLKVKNQGSNAIGVRAKIEGEYFIEESNKTGLDGAAKETVAQAANASMNTISGSDAMAKTYGSDWKVGNDGWHYYDGLVSPNSDTATNFITSLTFNAAATNNYNCYYATISNGKYIVDESKRSTPVDSSEAGNIICVSEAEQGEVNYANADYKIYVTFETIQGTAVSSVWGSSIPAAATNLSTEATSAAGLSSKDDPSLVLYDIIAKQAVSDTTSSTYVTNSNGIQFNTISSDTNGKGVYDFGNGIYYYRGAVEDNNVIFDNKCWQIIRTTASGTVKMIYNGVPDNGTCPKLRGSAARVESMAYNSSFDQYDYPLAKFANYRTSTVKTYLEGTFLPTISASAQAKLAQTRFYLEYDPRYPSNDSYYGNGEGAIQSFAPANRLYGYDQNNGEAITDYFTTMNKDRLYIDRGSDTYDSLVGLLQMDEVILAGVDITTNEIADSDLSYIISGSSYWTLSPNMTAYSSVYVFSIRTRAHKSNLYNSSVTSSNNGVRPVVSLKTGTKIAGGDGSVAAPYQINLNS